MDFVIRAPKETIITLARKIGYQPVGVNDENEYSLVRPLAGRSYPRFHIYAKKDEESNGFYFNLHLDQKQPSYQGSSAHSGEYEGDLVEKEESRIQSIVAGLE